MQLVWNWPSIWPKFLFKAISGKKCLEGSTLLNNRPIEIHVKIPVFFARFEAFWAIIWIFDVIQPIQNRWNFNICFNVRVVFHLDFAQRAVEERPHCFRHARKPQNPFSAIFQSADLFSLCLWNSSFFVNKVRVLALSFHFIYNTLLYFVYNSTQEAQIYQKSFVFSRNSLGFHKMRIDLVECSLQGKTEFHKILFFDNFRKIWSIWRNNVKFQCSMMFSLRAMVFLSYGVKSRNTQFRVFLAYMTRFVVFE